STERPETAQALPRSGRRASRPCLLLRVLPAPAAGAPDPKRAAGPAVAWIRVRPAGILQGAVARGSRRRPGGELGPQVVERTGVVAPAAGGPRTAVDPAGRRRHAARPVQRGRARPARRRRPAHGAHRPAPDPGPARPRRARPV